MNEKQRIQCRELMERVFRATMAGSPHGAANYWNAELNDDGFDIHYEETPGEEQIALSFTLKKGDAYDLRFSDSLNSEEVGALIKGENSDGKVNAIGDWSEGEIVSILVAIAQAACLQRIGGLQRFEVAETLRQRIESALKAEFSEAELKSCEIKALGNGPFDGTDPGMNVSIQRDGLEFSLYLIEGDPEITIHGSKELFEPLEISSRGGKDVTEPGDEDWSQAITPRYEQMLDLIIDALRYIARDK